MLHPIEVQANAIDILFQELLDISDELEACLDDEEAFKLSRFDWIALAEQRWAEEHFSRNRFGA